MKKLGISEKFLTLVLLLMVCAVWIAGCGGAKPAPAVAPEKAAPAGKMKIAMLLPGPANDAGWNTAAYQGLMKFKELGHEVAFTENVAVANIEETFRNYAGKGFGLVIGHGFQFGDPALKVAAQSPNSKFFVSGNTPPNAKTMPNVGFIDQKEFEAAYLCGIIAGMTTKSNKIGYVGGMEIPSQLANLAAFTKGVESVNPNARIFGIITGSFGDPAKGKEAATAQIENGADIIMQTADSTGLGAIEAAKAKKVLLIGYGADQSALAPDLFLTSLIPDMTKAIVQQTERIEKGTFGGVWKAGIKDGIIDIAPPSAKVSQAAKDKAAQVKKDIIEGKFSVPEIYERIDKK